MTKGFPPAVRYSMAAMRCALPDIGETMRSAAPC